MAVKWFGKTDSNTFAADHLTPASAVYCWGFDEWSVITDEPDAPIEIYQAEFGDVLATMGYKIDHVAHINHTFVDLLSYQRWKMARGYWKKNNKLLYIVAKNSWASNLMVYAPYATPETLTDWTGIFVNHRVLRFETNAVRVRSTFALCTEIISV